jgi:hypothetical protein
LTNEKIEAALPVFAGALGSLVLCALLAIRGPGLLDSFSSENQEIALEKPAAERPAELDAARLFAGPAVENRDIIQELYRDVESQEWVVDFFTGLCNSLEIAQVILSNADAFNISPSLAFALSWEESRFNPMAVNNRNRDESIDRGLFQLNNRSFPRLEEPAFFDPRVNAWYGMGHLRHCLDSGGTEIAALAMYNAGSVRVKSAGTPKTTLDYIHRIMENRGKIENRFQARLRQESDSPAAEKSRALSQGVFPPDEELDALLEDHANRIAEAKPGSYPRFRALAPLAGR